MMSSSAFAARSADTAFERDRRPLQVSLSVEQPRAAVDETPADVQERKERNLAGLVGALRLTLFHFERRHDLLSPRVDGLFGLLHPHGGGTDVAHDLRSDSGVLPARPLDFRVGATDPTLVAREERHVETHAGSEFEPLVPLSIGVENPEQA